MFAIGITVALVPEGLLPTVTLSLAIGAQRMADQHALVRRLESVETLGSTTFICTDKTGTLTQNRMRIVEVWMPEGRVRRVGTGYEPVGEIESVSVGIGPMTDAAAAALRDLATVARGCSRGRVALTEDGVWMPSGDPMEAAIDSLAIQLTGDTLDPVPSIARFAFDPRRRRSSVVTHDRVLVKGAPDAIIERCTIEPDDEATVRGVMKELSDRGLRVLAVAARTIADAVPTTADDAEADLELRGLLGFEDPPRLEARAALAACRQAGIRVAMITGDSPLTARAIADETGLRPSDGLVLIGAELPDDDQVLGALVDRDGVVIARVTPEDKLRIARALQSARTRDRDDRRWRQ